MSNEKTTTGFYTGTETEPFRRLRRLRMTDAFRAMVRETELTTKDLIYPLFVVPGSKVRREVTSMPGVYQLSIDEVVRECAEVKSLGIPAIILFGIPSHKDEVGSEAYDEEGIVQLAIRAIKSRPLRVHLPRALRDRQGE
jgi:porphobilinogen synthase